MLEGLLPITRLSTVDVADCWAKRVISFAPIEKLCAVEFEGIEGVICGRAIYNGALDFRAAQRRADELVGA